jgi:hypothetical protein
MVAGHLPLRLLSLARGASLGQRRVALVKRQSVVQLR